MEVKSMVERLKEYLDNSSEEQLKKDYEELSKYNENGISVKDFLEEIDKWQKLK